MYPQIVAEKAPRAYRDQLISLVRDRKEASERFGRTFRMKLPRLYDLWRGVFTGNYLPTKNDVHIPLIYSSILSDVARKVATSFTMQPFVTFRGYGPYDAPTARKNESLISAQFSDARVIEKESVTFMGADLYGTSVSQTMWEHKEETRSRTDWRALPLSGERVRQIMREKVVTFDGPNYRNIDLLDFFPQPNYRSIHDMRWVIVRYYLDLDECRFLASEEGGKVFAKSEVERMERDSASGHHRNDEMLIRRFDMRMGLTDQQRFSDKHSRPVEIIEMWGYIPNELAGPIGSPNVVISVANDNYLFRAAENPFHHQAKPFLVYQPTPDPHYFYAPGKAEVAMKMQVVINRLVNQLLDAGDIVIHPMMVYNRNRVTNTRRLVAGPGRIFGVDGNPAEALAPVPFDMRGLSIGASQVQLLWNFIQMGTGVQEDTVMGMGGTGSDRQTAREFMGRREASGTRLMLESVLYEHNYLEPLANQFASMNAQLLDVPREILILGDSAQMDPVTNEPIPVSRETVYGWDLIRSYSARALGSTMAISKTQRQSTDLTVFQILAGAQPLVAGRVNMVNFLRQMLRNLDYQNVDELIKNVPEMEELLAQQQGGIGGVPESGDMEALAAMAGGSTGPMTEGSPMAAAA